MTTYAAAVADRDTRNYPPQRPAQGGLAARAGIMRATALACMVRDEATDTIGTYLDDLTLDQLYATVVALAAMVPDDRPVEDLLGWLEHIGVRLELDAIAARRAAAKAAA